MYRPITLGTRGARDLQGVSRPQFPVCAIDREDREDQEERTQEQQGRHRVQKTNV